jgi:hypothetical protein
MSTTIEDPKTVVAQPKKNGNGHSAPAVVHHDDEQDFLLRIARDPSIDADKLRAVADVFIIMQEKQRTWAREDQQERARIAFYTARAPMQAELPVLEKDIPNQEGKGKFADFGDLWEACLPVWTKHGFIVSFDIVPLDNGLIRVKLLLDHVLGHREEYLAPDTPPDTSGPRGTINKTIPQGSQSTVTYVQRGVLCRALGIGMKREDDDGNSGARDDNPHRPHTKSTQQRETREPIDHPVDRRPTANWVESSYQRLDATKSAEDWMTTLGYILAAAPSATETSQLATRLKDYVEKIPDRAARGKVSAMFRDRHAGFAPAKSDTVSDTKAGKSDTGSDTPPPLSEDEQWAEDQISQLSLVWDMNSFLTMVDAARARMAKLRDSNRPLYERVKREYEAAQDRIAREAVR